MRSVAVFDFDRPVEELNEKALYIHGKMSVNPLMANPPVPYVDFLDQVNAQRTAYQNALNGGKLEKQVLIDTTKVVQGTVRRMQSFVNAVANGDRETIISSGFDVSREPTPVGDMPKATIRWIRNTGAEGEVQVRLASIRGKKYFEVQLKVADPSTSFATVPASGNCIFLLSGLGSLRRYIIRVRAYGPNGPGPWSDEQQFTVL